MSNDWRKEFKKRWFIENGQISVENYVDIEAFITDLLTQLEREVEKERDMIPTHTAPGRLVKMAYDSIINLIKKCKE